MKDRLLKHYTWREYKEVSEDGVLIIPIGATEQHGPHLPLGVDLYISEHFANKLSEEINGYVAPSLNYGYKSNPTSGGGPLFPGTIDLTGKTLCFLIEDILKEYIKDGWEKIIIMNGHFENEAFISEAIDIVIGNQEEEFPKVLIMSWWDNISQKVVDRVFDEVPFRGWDLEHAAITETSLMMNFESELVRKDKLTDDQIEVVPSYKRYPIAKDLVPKSGALYTSISSTKEKGELITKNVLENFLKIVNKEF